MKSAKRLGLISAAVLVFSALNIPAPAADGTVAAPVAYALSADGGESVSLRAYEIDGGAYFKLRGLAAAMKFSSGCDGEKHTAQIGTSPETGPAEDTGEAFDTWEKLCAERPEAFDGYHETPLSPVFHGAEGLYPIGLSSGGGDYAAVYLRSGDYGKTWTHDEAYNLAQMWAQAIQNRDGRAQYALLSGALQAEFRNGYEALNWVTGVSSPWVGGWTIEVSQNRAVIVYENETSTGFAGYTKDTLTFSEENGQLRIGGIEGVNDLSKALP